MEKSSSTQPTSLLTAPSKVFTPNSVADEGYPPEVTPNDDSALDSETPPPEADRTGPEPSHVSSPSNAASSILGLKDRFQKLKETLKLTPDQEREFQACINAVGELEAQGGDWPSSSSESDRDEPDERQHRLTDREWMGSNSSVVTFEESELGFGEMETEEQSHEETRPFPSMEEVKTAQALSKKSLENIVPYIYYQHNFLDHKQLSDVAFLFLMVVQAISKVWCIEEPNDATHETEIHVRRFLQESNDETLGIPNSDVLAIVRNAIAHGNVYLDGTNMRMYNQHRTQMKCTKTYTCTVNEFNGLSANMCALFLDWPKISEYLPKEDMDKATEEAS